MLASTLASTIIAAQGLPGAVAISQPTIDPQSLFGLLFVSLLAMSIGYVFGRKLV